MHRHTFTWALACAGLFAGLVAPPASAQILGARVRLQITPKIAAVYVDGLYAGIVDDFDGPTERLPLPAGPHELVVHLAGYRTTHQQVDLGNHAEYRIRYAMEKLGESETAEPPPAPPAAPSLPALSQIPVASQDYGIVAIRVQPADADVFLDGERWIGSGGADDPLAIHARAGRHHVEIRKQGYRPFSTDIEVRAAETVPVNVSLAPEND